MNFSAPFSNYKIAKISPSSGAQFYTQCNRTECIYYKNRKQLNINGPARLTKFLKVDKKFNGKIVNKKTGLWIEDREIKTHAPNPPVGGLVRGTVKKSQIIKTKRIGVEYAGKIWANKPYRFILKLSPENS